MKSTLLALMVTVMTTIAPDPWGVAQADVRVTCPLTIGGSFDAKTADLSGSVTASTRGTPSFDGTLAVDLRTLDTGIGLRNEHLRDRYLEVGKGAEFAAATLTGIGVVGLDPEAPEGKGAFSASLTLHGVTKAVTGSVDVRRANTGSLKVKALFPVALADYGIPVPRYLGVGVKDTVQVQVSFTAAHRAGR
jgi:polyisoprenoid-binding protein YceI